MASCFDLLPPELLEEIYSQLTLESLLRLSSTCKAQRSSLAPRVFKTIRFTNDAKVAESALLAARSHGQHTGRIEFSAGGAIGTHLSKPCLLPAATALLRGDFTPHATCAKIHFTFDYDDYGEEYDGGSIYTFDEAEDYATVREEEERLHWRQLMNEAWAALAKNKAISELEVLDLVPKKTSAFQDASFLRFLGQLERADFTLLFLDNGAGWHINTVEGFGVFAEEMAGIFFQHMTHLKNLTLRSESPLGRPSRFEAPLPLQAGHLPALHTLKLHNCYVGQELLDFLETAKALKSLDIDKCYACHPDSADIEEFGTTWAAFFDKVVEMQPAALTTLLAGETAVPLKASWDKEPDSDELQQARAELAKDKKLRVFGYATTDDKYGMFFDDYEVNLEEFNNREDYEAYKRLVAVVEGNGARS